MVWLSGLLPYEQVAAVFHRIGGISLPSASIWRQTRHQGERLWQQWAEAQKQVAVERVVLPPAGQDHQQRQGVSMDGGKVNIRGEGWKEFKTGAVYEIGLRDERDPQTDEMVEQAHAVQIAYTAVLGSVEEFAPALWALAVERRIPQAADLSVTADGADWIWNLTSDYFPDSVQIVDWYHAAEHLAQAATALHPTDEVAAHRWNQEHRPDLYLGAVQRLTEPLDHAGLQAHSQYFHKHARRMQYQEFREQGYLIGSGSVESGIKQFKHRLTGPGMRWSRPAAQQMLVIRAAVMTDSFDKLWSAALN